MKLKDGVVLSLDEVESFTRRDFCRTAGVGVVALLVPSACGGGGTPVPVGSDDAGATGDLSMPADMASACPSSVVDTGKKPADFAAGTGTYFASDNAFVCRDAKGLYVLSSICPHEGCAVTFQKNSMSFFCPCHASRFDFNGAVKMGPAVSPLDHFAVCVSGGGTIAFDTGTPADPADRLNA